LKGECLVFKRVMLIGTVFALVLASGAVNVFASGNASTKPCPAMYNSDTNTWTDAYFCDGRLNAYDLTEPVAVYYAYTTQPVSVSVTTTDQDKDETAQTMQTQMANMVSAINIWSIDPEHVGQLALSVPVSKIEPAFSATAPTQIASANGITLSFSPASDMFTVTDGSYAFTWKAWQ
jgi:hypothetical protein